MKLCDKDILYLDRQVMVVLKPYGVLTQEDPRENLQEAAKRYLQEYTGKSRPFCMPILRLDKSVAGIVVFARTSKALQRLQSALRERKRCKKVYYARVEGKVAKGGILTHYLVKKAYHSRVFDSPLPEGKKAELLFTVIEKGASSILQIELITGRYHKIRAQLAHIGHPICGDRKYGALSSKKGIDLYHMEMSFPHPISGESIRVCAKPLFSSQ